ncbi:tyrosine protein phosphatase [Solwaraspora sp. WMMD406]|uniref:phosphatase domain-containing putative toxin n=1 Tax=Solwaraspora sp. WMMD406 TaxID=3016095 RepID=UPI0024167382|nr:tyrosine protein phosphatase [Solwaraspora sp. WMMD406]MDG4767576.1 tyrosine protein phosphatase [Solwaraspora sp. WMMD406]
MTMTPPVAYPVPTPSPGTLSIMARPAGGDRLDDDLAALVDSGAHLLVCLLTADELDELGLSDEPAAADRGGLEFHHFPIADFSVPDRAAADQLTELIVDRLLAGRHVVVHCRAGIGRSSLVAAASLVRLGLDHEDVWPIVSAARGVPVPETEEQRRWLAYG